MIGKINQRDAVKSFEATLNIIRPNSVRVLPARSYSSDTSTSLFPVSRQKFETIGGEIEWWRSLGFGRG
jgi:hypothetical protein